MGIVMKGWVLVGERWFDWRGGRLSYIFIFFYTPEYWR